MDAKITVKKKKYKNWHRLEVILILSLTALRSVLLTFYFKDQSSASKGLIISYHLSSLLISIIVVCLFIKTAWSLKVINDHKANKSQIFNMQIAMIALMLVSYLGTAIYKTVIVLKA